LGFILRNEAYIGKLYQFKRIHIEPKKRLKPLSRNKKTSSIMRPKEEWIQMNTPALVAPELFEAVQRKITQNAAFPKRNTKRKYLLSGLLYCSICGGRMNGHAMHGVLYYRCYHKGDPDRFLKENDNVRRPCVCPEIKTELLEIKVWNTVCQLIKDPKLLIHKLHQSNNDSSAMKEILERELQICRKRLEAIPKERKRLIEGYRKGMYSDSLMREEMDVIDNEQSDLETRITDISKQLSRRKITKKQEADIRKMIKKINTGLNNLDFNGKQKLLRLLIEKINYDGGHLEIQTILHMDEELCTINRGGLRG